MSQSESGEVNRREVAYRLFAAEFEDADYSYAESDEERAPNYVVTPTGARVNRVFVVGVLTEVAQVSEDVVRARVVDPTGAFVVYAGQYQPEALAALESAETPSFVAVTGKARTFQPDDSEVVYTSIRPEAVSEVDAETRDRWVVSTAEQTVDRVATAAAAHDRVERGDRLREVLERAGVQPGLAAGIPLALDHYGTTPAYLAAVRDLAVEAARVVAGEADAAGDLALSPDEGGDAALDFAADLDADAAAADEAAPAGAVEAESETAVAAEGETGAQADSGPETDSETDEARPDTDEGDSGAVDAEAGESEGDVQGSVGEPEAESVSPEPAAETPSPGDVAAEAAPEGGDGVDDGGSGDGGGDGGDDGDGGDGGDGELYELSEEERREVEENFDVEFSTGSDIPDAGEADAETPEPDAESATAAGGESGDESATAAGGESGDESATAAGGDETGEGDGEAVDSTADDEEADERAADGDDELGDFTAEDEAFDESQEESDTTTDFTEDEYDEPASDREDAEGGEPDLDLEDYVVDLMDRLDDGDGAPREDVVATAADERDADEGEVEDAIQAALMSGRCYEAGDDHLKAI
ncbi:hypothetical protein [Halobacterium yunchengense]|uniref:hypothetical protein n=1 Tax=Halobacterium yunchengense TaxID=3108497 RepID=UPI00300AF6C9